MIEILLLTALAVVLTLAVGFTLSSIPMLLRLRRLVREDARRDVAGRWSMFEGDDA